MFAAIFSWQYLYFQFAMLFSVKIDVLNGRSHSEEFKCHKKIPTEESIARKPEHLPCDQLFLFTSLLTISILIILFNYKESSNG